MGNQQLSIHIKTLLDYLKSSKNYCPRKLFSGSNSSPEKSLQKNRSIFGLENRSCDRRYELLEKVGLVSILVSLYQPLVVTVLVGVGLTRISSQRVGVGLTWISSQLPVSDLHRCRRFGRLALTDRSVGHGRYRRFHLRDNTVDIDGRFGYTYGE